MVKQQPGWVEIDFKPESSKPIKIKMRFSTNDVHTDRSSRMIESIQQPLPLPERERALRRSAEYGS